MFKDFKELLSVFNALRVSYLIVGGYAVSFHAQPRATKNLDILLDPANDNSKAVYAALTEFGAPLQALEPKDFTEPDGFFRMGTPAAVYRDALESRQWHPPSSFPHPHGPATPLPPPAFAPATGPAALRRQRRGPSTRAA